MCKFTWWHKAARRQQLQQHMLLHPPSASASHHCLLMGPAPYTSSGTGIKHNTATEPAAMCMHKVMLAASHCLAAAPTCIQPARQHNTDNKQCLPAYITRAHALGTQIGIGTATRYHTYMI